VEYPRAYWPQMTAMARATGVDPYLLLSIARQESLFRPRAVSHAGATGVMQLMPATARYLARIEPAVTDDDFNHLTHPARSIRMGAYYMMRMIERSEGNLVFALGSYNGGPGNMAKWRRAYPASDLDAFIDAVPFRETRGYIRKVLGNYAAYRSLYPAWSADSER
jgi:soluble lytic murein transglycosylase